MNTLSQGTYKAAMIGILLCAMPLPRSGVALADSNLVQWSATVEITPKQRIETPELAADLAANMQARQINATVREHQVQLSGYQALNQLRGLLFDEGVDAINLLDGPVELTLELASDTQPITLELETRLTTGYRWEVVEEAGSRYTQRDRANFAMRYQGPGAPAIQTIQIQPKASGIGQVRLLYRRPFEPNTPIRTRLNMRMPRTNGLIELTDPTPTEPTSDTVPDASGASTRESLPLVRQALPTAYDARHSGIVPAIRDQGACGSCWAFGTVGVMEIAVRKSGAVLPDLSEQFLVSCNREGWGCDGGLTASHYHTNTLARSQTRAGAVLEADASYSGTNGSCLYDYPKAHQGSSWRFITGSEWTLPANDAIKTAILNYGAVTAGVCVDDGWYSYSSGVYAPRSNVCGGSTNHQIILVGWDDSTQSWILRNSWGTAWGESGYMRIKYDPSGINSRVGEGASWILATTSPPSSMFSLSVSKSGGGRVTSSPAGIDCGGTCSASLTGGSSVTLTATPETGYRLSDWGGACDSTPNTANACTLVMDTSKSVVVQFEPASSGCTPSTTAIQAGGSMTGTLATTDCLSSVRAGRYYDDFRFEASAGSKYTITLNSTAFDSYLYLLDSAGRTLAYNDDVSSRSTNARIIYTPTVSGTLTIHATSYAAEKTGGYTLALSAATPPAAPSNLTGSAISSTRIDLNWSDNSTNETGFKLERKIGSSGAWSQIATLRANVTGYSNTRLRSRTTYYYRIRAYNANGHSSYSDALMVTTP